jgi:hypothetical protein
MELQKAMAAAGVPVTAATYLKRYEQKYLLNEKQYRSVTELLNGRFTADVYGKSVIYSVYYDTDDYRIIRKAFTPGTAYREKLRLRSYGEPQRPDDTVYVELKKKFQGMTYKRRFAVPFGSLGGGTGDAPPLPSLPAASSEGSSTAANSSSLYGEFAWFYQRYALSPKFFIVYDRLALQDSTNPFIRITFDTNIRCRRGGFFESTQRCSETPRCSEWASLTDENQYLMEMKTVTAVPLYVSRFLSSSHIFPVSYSKLKTAYRKTI